jgi:5-methylcytosine-specific restriction endonuclease McrA
MILKGITPPWQKKGSYGHRNTRDPHYQSTAWKKMVDYIWLRDNGTCQICLSEGKLKPLIRGTNNKEQQGIVDHKVQRKMGGTDEDDNLQLVCNHHHAVKSANEGNQMRKK